LLFTAFGNPFLNFDITKPISSVPHIIFTYSASPYNELHALAWTASFLLITFILILNITAKLLARRWKLNL
jgi:phosphate transport system permease protein